MSTNIESKSQYKSLVVHIRCTHEKQHSWKTHYTNTQVCNVQNNQVYVIYSRSSLVKKDMELTVHLFQNVHVDMSFTV